MNLIETQQGIFHLFTNCKRLKLQLSDETGQLISTGDKMSPVHFSSFFLSKFRICLAFTEEITLSPVCFSISSLAFLDTIPPS